MCISHSGVIVSIKQSIGIEGWNKEIVQEGIVDSGIAAAVWNPEQTMLIIVTNNNSILAMSNTWDVLQEIPIESRVPISPCSISWRADGEFMVLLSVDAEDSVTKVRVYNKDLEFVALGRNVAEGPASVLKGLGSTVAFGCNGSLIAVPQQRVKRNHQIALLEKNGLRHSDIDVKCPPLPAGYDEWVVTSLHWDLASTLLAVGLTAIKEGAADPSDKAVGVVQLYYRNNYFWYLKYQWSDVGLKCLGFDTEIIGRLYLSQSCQHVPVIRIIDAVWDVTTSTTPDATTVVVNGADLLVTPLGISLVPPPMSRYKVTLTNPCLQSCFWQHTVWGLVCLCDNYSIALLHGDDAGSPTVIGTINLLDEAEKYQQIDLSMVKFRSICAHKCTEDVLCIAVVGNRINSIRDCADTFDDDFDEILLVHYNLRSAKVETVKLRVSIAGKITRILPWPQSGNTAPSMAVCMLSTSSSAYEVVNMVIDESTDETVQHFHDYISNVEAITIPETCTHLALINACSADHTAVKAIGLSNRNRLYCGEALIMAGVSSFTVNDMLGLLLYTTVGTRPHLHFIALSTLASLDPLQMGVDQHILDSAEPRPIERGGRIITSVPGDPKVIIQLPRGNLETFEPRAITLLKIRKLLDREELFTCLQLLRRQRVDLNYLVDYNQTLFFRNVQLLATKSIESKAGDLLNLLISSLEGSDVTIYKYPTPLALVTSTTAAVEAKETGDSKVNKVCTAIRDALLPLLNQGNEGALNPILCTYARQKPPLLTEALELIKMNSQSSSSVSQQQAKMQNAIKFLVFLKDNTVLFDAALANCDFDMAKAIARQCQMDPKVYMPLIERFEAIGKGYYSNPKAFQYTKMHYCVHIHLKQHEAAVSWGAKCIESLMTYNNSNVTNSVEEAASIGNESLAITKESSLYEHTLPLLTALVYSNTAAVVDQKVQQYAKEFLRQVRIAYAVKCVSTNNCKEAITAYLSLDPPMVDEAVRAARQDNNWATALLIAGRFQRSNPNISPIKIAQEIVAAHREMLEQSDMGEYEDSDFQDNDSSFDKNIEAATMCVDYCNDIEGAIQILLMSKKWNLAMQVAMKSNRHDLVQSDVGPSIRTATKDLMKVLDKRCKVLVEYVQQLSVLWSNPAQRLQDVASTDNALMEELKGGNNSNEFDDHKSEYSALTAQTGASNISYASSVSHSSSRSGTSTVSVLSNLSMTSNRSASSSASSFGIEGIAHTLLSRGTVTAANTNYDKNDNILRKKKRKEKTYHKGEGKDVWDLKKEAKMCNSMWLYANISKLSAIVMELIDILVLLNEKGDYELATALQCAMDKYSQVVQANPPSMAPLYPLDWLSRRLMLSVQYFQDRSNSEDNNTKASETYWEKSAQGIQVWLKARRVTLIDGNNKIL